MLAKAVERYDFKQEIEAPIEELLAIETQHPAKGIIKLDEMARFIDMVNSTKIIRFSRYKCSSIYINDNEMEFIDKLIDNDIINRLLANDGYSPVMRRIFPAPLFEPSCSRR